jgi:shikimate kinase
LRLVLIGFMGSGKSTLGARLAQRGAVPFADLDDEIERRAGCTVTEIFAREGESGFRARELDALADLAAALPAPAVVATGGGIVETDAALPLLQQLGRIVWLRADPEPCIARLGAAGAARPLLQTDWRARYDRRAARYAAWSEAIVSTHPETVEASLAALVAVCPFAVQAE